MAATPRFSAIVVGCTGAIGRDVVRLLVNHENCDKIIGCSRRTIEPEHWSKTFGVTPAEASSKLSFRALNYDNLTEANFRMDDGKGPAKVFYCLGTTRKDAGSAEAFRKVDLDYVTMCAKLCKACNVEFFGLVSASNANKDSWFLYPQVKGLAEEAVKEQAFPHTAIFRPGLLNRGDQARTVEKMFLWIAPSTPTEAVAKAMIECSVKSVEPQTVSIVTDFSNKSS